MNIGVFTDTFKPCTNGVVDAVWRVCKGFQKEGHNVHLFALSDTDSDEIVDGVHIHKFKGKRFKLYPDLLIRYTLPLRRVLKLVKKYKIEVIHSNVHLIMGLTALIVSILKKKPLITTFHTLVPEFVDCFLKSYEEGDARKPVILKILGKLKLEKLFIKLGRKFVWAWMRYFNTAKWLIVPSNYTKKILIKHGMDRNKIIIIPNPIEAKKKKKKKSQNLILHVGRLSAEKRVDVLIKALKHVKHDYKAVITSDGPLRDYLINLAKKEGVSDKVIFTGFIPRKQLEDYYDKAALFVSAAEYDTFNNCVAEALVHNTPVIINRNSGATDFVKQGGNGIIIENNDPKEYARKIDWLLFNKDVRDALSKAGEKIKSYTSINNITKQIEKIYTKLRKDHRLKLFKDMLIYGISSAFIYSVIFIGSIFERN